MVPSFTFSWLLNKRRVVTTRSAIPNMYNDASQCVLTNTIVAQWKIQLSWELDWFIDFGPAAAHHTESLTMAMPISPAPPTSTKSTTSKVKTL
jgi:hypothetical protein